MDNFKLKIQKLFKTDTNMGQVVFFAFITAFYWIVLVFLPIIVMFLFTKDAGLLIYCLIVMPLLFMIPYKIASGIVKYQMLFVLFGFVAPYIYIVIYVYRAFMDAFGRVSF